jgi:ABC-type microcin C transport system permease subunit YejB
VSENAVYYRHALKSALNPVITLGGLELAVIMGGATVTETVFGLDAVGRLAINSALEGDYPVVIGTTIFAAAVFVLCNLVVDVVTDSAIRPHAETPSRPRRAVIIGGRSRAVTCADFRDLRGFSVAPTHPAGSPG